MSKKPTPLDFESYYTNSKHQVRPPSKSPSMEQLYPFLDQHPSTSWQPLMPDVCDTFPSEPSQLARQPEPRRTESKGPQVTQLHPRAVRASTSNLHARLYEFLFDNVQEVNLPMTSLPVCPVFFLPDWILAEPFNTSIHMGLANYWVIAPI